MKTLTEIVKNVKTSGKNLVVYSSMLLALTGAYACGGNDSADGGAQSSQDGGYNPLQDAGNNNLDGGSTQSGAINCERLCASREVCECKNEPKGYDVEGCKTQCQNSQQVLANIKTDVLDRFNKCTKDNQGYGKCEDDCQVSGASGCLVPSNSYADAYCNKKAECTQLSEQQTKECTYNAYLFTYPFSLVCFNSDWFAKNAQSNIDCLNNVQCSDKLDEDLNNCTNLPPSEEEDKTMNLLLCG